MLDHFVCFQVFGDDMQVKLYAPPQSKIDPSIAVMLLIAIITVVLGGYWSGECERWDNTSEYCLWSLKMNLLSWWYQFKGLSVYDRDRLNAVGESGGGREGKGESGELFLYSPVKVIIFVGLMCGMLVLMYFFYNILGEWNHKTTHVSFDIIVPSILLTCSVFLFFAQFTSLLSFSAWHLRLHCSAVLMQ